MCIDESIVRTRYIASVRRYSMSDRWNAAIGDDCQAIYRVPTLFHSGSAGRWNAAIGIGGQAIYRVPTMIFHVGSMERGDRQ
jgi:hypothetical protein